MRGDAERQANMLLAVTPASFIPHDHPIRAIKPIVEGALVRLSSLFDDMYADRGRPSIPPEHLLEASLLIALYSIRSERQFCERRRKLVEEVFGWIKTVGGGRKLRFVGLDRNRCWLELIAAADNLVRMARLETAPL